MQLTRNPDSGVPPVAKNSLATHHLTSAAEIYIQSKALSQR